MSTAFHPQTDGQTERMNRTLEDMLRAYTTYHQNKWDECLAAAEFAYNNSKQASTGFTPFKLDNGQNPLTPINLGTNTSTNVNAANELYNNWTNNLQIAKDALMIAQERQSYYANQHRREETYQIGDKVLLSTAHMHDEINKKRSTKKLNPKYIGPYTITQVILSTVYKLALPSNMRIHPVFHVSLLKHYQQDHDEFSRESIPSPIIIPETNEEEYEVEQILDVKTLRRKKYYLVK